MFKLSPITQKRLERFKKIKRAYWSFWILAATFIISLFANLYCNNIPYIVKFQSQLYWPMFKNYVLSDFVENAPSAPVNYKDFKNSKEFKANPENYMLFPPIPYGAEETIAISSLNLPKKVSVAISKEPSIGSIDISENLLINKAQTPQFFFEPDQKYKKQPLAEFTEITPELKQALDLRFQNQKTNAFEVTQTFNKKTVKLSMLESQVEDSPPSKVRIRLVRLSTSEEKSIYEQNIPYDTETQEPKAKINLLELLTDTQKEEMLAKIKQRFSDFVDPIYFDIENQSWKVSFNGNDAFHPYKPIASNPMGFTDSGRDVLSQMIYGYRIALSFGLLLVTFTMLIGVIIGGIQGYFAGNVDIYTQRAIEIWAALPFLYVMIYLGNIYGKGFMLLLLIYGAFNWIGISYYMRAEFLRLRKTGYVEAAKCLGISNFKIMRRHILPNALVPIVTFLPFSLVAAINSLAMLDYLGFGLPPGTPSWGDLMSQGNANPGSWWLILYPSLALFFVMLLGTLIGDGLRAAFDPRKFHKIE